MFSSKIPPLHHKLVAHMCCYIAFLTNLALCCFGSKALFPCPNERTVISSTVFVAPVDGTVCGCSTNCWRSTSLGSESISNILLAVKFADVCGFPNCSYAWINLCTWSRLNPIDSAQLPNSPCAKSLSLTCFSRLPISNIASPATR